MTAQSAAAPAGQQTGRGRIRVGSAPDSWGVWFADDPEQVPWQRFLDEVSGCGYEWIELGPYGYLPTDPARLADELARRGLKVAGGTMHGHSGLHRAGDLVEEPLPGHLPRVVREPHTPGVGRRTDPDAGK